MAEPTFDVRCLDNLLDKSLDLRRRLPISADDPTVLSPTVIHTMRYVAPTLSRDFFTVFRREYGHLQIRSTLGSGGSAHVYAVHGPEDITYAMKVLHTVSDERVAAFQREAGLLRRLSLAGCSVPDYIGSHVLEFRLDEHTPGETSRVPFYFMQHLGPTYYRSNQVSPSVHVRNVARSVGETISSLHELGHRHNDLKPANIHISKDGTVRLLDFGSCTPVEYKEGLGIQFSPCYVAPERIHDESTPSEKSDVFSLGVTLYEIATGKLPFGPRITHRDTTTQLYRQLNAVRNGAYRPLHEYSLDIASQTATLIHGMLRHDPLERPTINEILATLS